MAHAQKPDFVFRRNGRVHLNRRGRQFSRLLAAEVCASAVVMLDTPRSEVVWVYWLPPPFGNFPFTSPPVRHRVPSVFSRTILGLGVLCLFWFFYLFFNAAYALYLYSYSQHWYIYCGLYSCSLGYILTSLLFFLHWFPSNLIIFYGNVNVLWV